MHRIFWILIILISVGCNDNNNATTQEEKVTTDPAALEKPLNLKKQQVSLLPEAQIITSEWLAYITAQNEIENLKKYSLKDVISNASPIAEIMQNLRETVPDTIKNNAVMSRVTVLYTKAKVLEQQANSRTIQPKQIAATAQELPVDFNNLKIQINEIFLKSLEDFELELDAIEEIENPKPPRKNMIPKRIPKRIKDSR
jgi:hypothetical protein